MPPEQVAGDPIDARADLFAVGCTMFEMASGRLPHLGSTEIELMVKMGMMPAPPLASVLAAADPGLCLVVDRALAFAKERRYPDAATMQADVRALRAGAAPPYASALIAAGDAPNPPETSALPAPIAPPAPTQYDAAYRPATNLAVASYRPATAIAIDAAGAKSTIEVAAVAVPAPSIRGGDQRDRLIAAIAVVTTLALCLAVVTWRVLRSSHGDDVATETSPPAAVAPSPSTTDDPAPTDAPLVGDDPPAARPANTVPRSPAPQGNVAPASPPGPGNVAPAQPAGPGPAPPIAPTPQANRPPAGPAPQSLAPAAPPPPSHGNGKGKGKGKKH
jgi:hypothetical protein